MKKFKILAAVALTAVLVSSISNNVFAKEGKNAEKVGNYEGFLEDKGTKYYRKEIDSDMKDKRIVKVQMNDTSIMAKDTKIGDGELKGKRVYYSKDGSEESSLSKQKVKSQGVLSDISGVKNIKKQIILKKDGTATKRTVKLNENTGDFDVVKERKFNANRAERKIKSAAEKGVAKVEKYEAEMKASNDKKKKGFFGKLFGGKKYDKACYKEKKQACKSMKGKDKRKCKKSAKTACPKQS